MTTHDFDPNPDTLNCRQCGTCVIHLAPRAVEEDRRVCWEYDGKDDCLFSTTPEADAVLRKVAEHIREGR